MRRLISLIGSRWLTSADAKGRPRLENPEDFVRLELEAALGRDVRVIPALVQNAQMPGSDELPETLRPFARRNAVELSDTRWTFDVGKLVATLERLESGLAVREEADREESERETRKRAEAEAHAEAAREPQEPTEAEAHDLAPALDEAVTSEVVPGTERAQEPEVVYSDARPRPRPMPVDRPRAVRPSRAAKLFARLDPRGALSWPARLARLIALTAVLITALIIFIAAMKSSIGWIVVLILVVLAVYAVRRRRRRKTG